MITVPVATFIQFVTLINIRSKLVGHQKLILPMAVRPGHKSDGWLSRSLSIGARSIVHLDFVARAAAKVPSNRALNNHRLPKH